MSFFRNKTFHPNSVPARSAGVHGDDTPLANASRWQNAVQRGIRRHIACILGTKVDSILRILTSGGVFAFRKIFVPPKQVNAGTDLTFDVGIGSVPLILAREAVSQ